MNTPGSEDALALRRLNDLVAQGQALLEARKDPQKGRAAFPDYSAAYRRWYIAGKDLIAALSGPSAAKEWGLYQCTGMYSLDQSPPFVVTEHERQQGMLLELRKQLTPDPQITQMGATGGNASGTNKLEPRMNADGHRSAGAEVEYTLKPDARDATDAELLEDLRQTAKAMGQNTITRHEYQFHGRWYWGAVARRFTTWNKALVAAGLPLASAKNIPAQALFENFARVWQALGRQPVEADMVKPHSEYSTAPYRQRFGGWREMLEAFVTWAKEGKTLEEEAKPPSHGASDHGAPEDVSQPSQRLRFIVFQRDSFRCTACGRSPANEPGVKLQVDHKVPRSRGGRTTLPNLTTLCQKCNIGKGDMTTG